MLSENSFGDEFAPDCPHHHSVLRFRAARPWTPVNPGFLRFLRNARPSGDGILETTGPILGRCLRGPFLASKPWGQLTRFLVVTHNPITMARMDRLFGVTMAERGISRLVSVDLSQAEALRESA